MLRIPSLFIITFRQCLKPLYYFYPSNVPISNDNLTLTTSKGYVNKIATTPDIKPANSLLKILKFSPLGIIKDFNLSYIANLKAILGPILNIFVPFPLQNEEMPYSFGNPFK